jgi:hypothetical protein
MTWSLFRWVWRLEAPLHVGIPPAGSLDRCRLYLPARNLWAALTAALARQEMGDTPKNHNKYQEIGKELQRSYRFSYLYPSERCDGEWRAWLPFFAKGNLYWRKEAKFDITLHSAFRGRLLDSRPGTAIDPCTDSAAEKSLHETEVVNSWWRGSQGSKAGPVAMIGYLFCRKHSTYSDLREVNLLYIGGDTRYGLGKLVRVEMEKAEHFFEYDVQPDQDDPKVFSNVVLAHTKADTKNDLICGALERLGGWNMGTPISMADTPFWIPGSRLTSEKWHKILDNGTWKTLL